MNILVDYSIVSKIQSLINSSNQVLNVGMKTNYGTITGFDWLVVGNTNEKSMLDFVACFDNHIPMLINITHPAIEEASVAERLRILVDAKDTIDVEILSIIEKVIEQTK